MLMLVEALVTLDHIGTKDSPVHHSVKLSVASVPLKLATPKDLETLFVVLADSLHQEVSVMESDNSRISRDLLMDDHKATVSSEAALATTSALTLAMALVTALATVAALPSVADLPSVAALAWATDLIPTVLAMTLATALTSVAALTSATAPALAIKELARNTARREVTASSLHSRRIRKANTARREVTFSSTNLRRSTRASKDTAPAMDTVRDSTKR